MKTICVGVTSSIAAYKSAQLVSDLIKKGYDVEVIMSQNATQFIQPLTFSTLTGHETYVDTFAPIDHYDVKHVALAKKCDAFIIAPATANVIAKVAHGLADDMLTTTFLAFDKAKLIAPAMNSQMYDNPITQDNLQRCKDYGMTIIEPVTGRLACGEEGKGKLADIDTMIDALEYALAPKPLLGKKALVTAGPTQEAIDPVRFISNHSSGKQGYAIAKVFRNGGAEVTLVHGPAHLQDIPNVKMVSVKNTQAMYDACMSYFDAMDYVVCAAAPADYASEYSMQKIKKSEENLTLSLHQNPDILFTMGERKTHQKLCGFAAESENELENAKAKLLKKHCDMIVVNNITQKQAGFQGDTNIVSIIDAKEVVSYPLMSKAQLAQIIVQKLTGG